MAIRRFFRCLGEALCANGLKALAGLVPLGASLVEIAQDACQRLREEAQEEQLRSLIESTAKADPAEVKAEAALVAAEVAAGQPYQPQVAAYLAQVPGAIRRSLRRPADPSGKSVPVSFSLRKPEDLLQLLPARLPRFQPGDAAPGMGDWVLDELLGVGGFGEVWKARHAYFDGIAPVALKFCLDETARDRLLKHEARVLNQVMRQGRHPGIVPLLDASLNSDPPCLKYEFIEGGDLTSLARDWPRSSKPRHRVATELIAQLAGIVAHAHRLTPPIVHRDLKPGNVMVQAAPSASDGEDLPVLRITDFGIGGIAARQAIAQTQTSRTTGETLGSILRGSHSPLYASPDQIRGEPADPRDDVHALGVMWYQLLLGDLNTGPPTGLWTDDLEEQGCSREMIRLLGACVASRAEKRPADAGVLAEQLRTLLAAARESVDSSAISPPRAELAIASERLRRFLETGQTGASGWMLDLTNQRIGDEGIKALAACPRLANLSLLILSGCDVGDEGIKALALSPHVLNLNRLDLWDNRIGDEGIKALAACRFLENLNRLDLGRNRIGDEGMKALAASEHFRHLNELLLVSNHIGDEGALALANSPHLANLAWLKPLDNRISAVGVDALRATFGRRVRVM